MNELYIDIVQNKFHRKDNDLKITQRSVRSKVRSANINSIQIFAYICKTQITINRSFGYISAFRFRSDNSKCIRKHTGPINQIKSCLTLNTCFNVFTNIFV